MQHLRSSRRRAQLNKEYRGLFIRSRKGAFSFSCTSGSTLRQKNRWVRVGTMCRCLRNSREGTFSELSTVPQLHVQFGSSKFLFSSCRVVEWSDHLNETKGKSRIGSWINALIPPYNDHLRNSNCLSLMGWWRSAPSCPFKRLYKAPTPPWCR